MYSPQRYKEHKDLPLTHTPLLRALCVSVVNHSESTRLSPKPNATLRNESIIIELSPNEDHDIITVFPDCDKEMGNIFFRDRDWAATVNIDSILTLEKKHIEKLRELNENNIFFFDSDSPNRFFFDRDDDEQVIIDLKKELEDIHEDIIIELGDEENQRVIELELNSTEPRLVIEANLDASNQIATVILSKSNDFYDNTDVEKISDANVSLENENGEAYALIEVSDGTYKIENIETNPGEIFTINIEVEGQSYMASAEVPLPVTLNEIIVSEASSNPFGGGGEDGNLMVSARWDDPEGMLNYYRIRTYVNGVFLPEIYTLITDDFVGDGNQITLPIRDRYEEGDEVTLVLLSSDEYYYDYFYQVSGVTGGGANSTTPFNPVGNFDQEVLGYFGIYFSSSLSVEL